MAIITRKGKFKTSYQVKVRDDFGRLFPTETFSRKIEAERHENLLLNQKYNGSNALNKQKQNITFSEYWKIWSDKFKQKVSDGWKSDQERFWRNYICPELGIKKLSQISRSDIRVLLNSLVTIKGLSNQTALHVYGLLNIMFSDAVEFEYMNATPISKRDRPQLKEVNRKYLTPKEAYFFLDAIKDDPISTGIWVMLLSGLRVGEMQALRVQDIDFENDQIFVGRKYNKKTSTFENFTKQGKPARYPLSNKLKVFLLEKCRLKTLEDFICTAPNGKLMVQYEYFNRRLKKLCNLHGVTEITSHELRHSTAEIWIDVGATQEDIRQLLQHSNSSVTKRYIHRTDDRLNTLGQRINHNKSSEPESPPKLKLVK